jgi:hypothetical protein
MENINQRKEEAPAGQEDMLKRVAEEAAKRLTRNGGIAPKGLEPSDKRFDAAS